MKNKKGFTLAELLIVVAIIAVLVAVSIHVFSSQLEKSREATDAANIRSQYSEIMVEALSEGKDVNTDGSRKIPLEQKQDNWQNDTFKNSLEGIATVEGTPIAGGTAWVSFEAENSKVTIHFDGAGGGEPSGGGSSGSITYQADSEHIFGGHTKMDTGTYSLSIDPTYTGTISFKLIVNAGGSENSSDKATYEVTINNGVVNPSTFNNPKKNASFSIKFDEDVTEEFFNEFTGYLSVTRIGS